MNDLEMVEQSAAAMGWRTSRVSNKVFYCPDEQTSVLKGIWNPLKDDSQAMALVKKLGLSISAPYGDDPDRAYYVSFVAMANGPCTEHTNLNRAIVECAAKIYITQRSAAKEGEEK